MMVKVNKSKSTLELERLKSELKSLTDRYINEKSKIERDKIDSRVKKIKIKLEEYRLWLK